MSVEHFTTDVLIIGAGPSGLVLACELARRGTPFRLIDKRAKRANICKAAGVMPRTLEIFEDLGVIDEFLDTGVHTMGMTMFAGRRRILDLDFAGLDTPYAMSLGLEQFLTEEILTNRLHELGGTIERGVGLQEFSQDDDGVTATLARDDDATEIVRAKFLVGCDGAHSTVRKQLRLPFPGSAFKQHLLVAHLRIDWDQPHGRMVEFRSPAGTVSAFPVTRGRWSIGAELDASQWRRHNGERPTLAQLQGLIDRRCAIPARLSDLVWSSYFRINQRQVPSYNVGRAFLAGDAAHIHSPAGGQGMNTGIQDAYNLGWKLSLACQGSAGAELLASYHAERHPIGKATLRLATLFQTELNRRTPATRCLRDCATLVAGNLKPVRELIARRIGELDYHYRGSPIVRDDADCVFPAGIECRLNAAAPRDGERAADALVATAPGDMTGPIIRMHELLRGPGHKLFLFEGSDSSRSRAALPSLLQLAGDVNAQGGPPIELYVVTPRVEARDLEAYDVPIVHDRDQTLHHRYAATASALYLIRPDGYIAYRSQSPDAQRLRDYVEQTFGRAVTTVAKRA